MKTKALRLHGASDLRLDEFELPPIKEDEMLCRVVSDSICMSSYKAAIQGGAHKRVPEDVEENPVIIGHECCGVIEEVGAKWQHKFKPGQKFAIQPARVGTTKAFGYSYHRAGGAATYIIIPPEYLEDDNLFVYKGDAFFHGSLAEPMSCIVGAYHANYHTTIGSYVHHMGIREGGNLIICAGAGPMGLGAVDLAIHGDRKPGRVVVTDIDNMRLKRAAEILTPKQAGESGVELHYVNTAACDDPKAVLMDLTEGHGFDDVFIFAPVQQVCELADQVTAFDGCINFFAGPTNAQFSAMLNYYDVHYNAHKVVGTSGGNTDDIRESLELMGMGRINPSCMITHIGGLDSAAEATLKLPTIPGGKKLIYTGIRLPLVAIEDFEIYGEVKPLFRELDRLVKAHNGLWNAEAERYLLEHAPKI